MEVAITNLEDREDWEGGLPDGDLPNLQGFLSLHHSLLWLQGMF